jgi:hypothetical protein
MLMPDPVNVGGMVDVTLAVCMRAAEVHARYYGHEFLAHNDGVKLHRKAIADAISEVVRVRGNRRG